MSKVGVYPGSFDPVTFGHLDIIERSSRLFEHVYVVVASNSAKNNLLSEEERVDLLKQVTSHLPNVTVEINNELVVSFVRKRGGTVMIRGLRAVSDFEYEMKLATTNQILDNEIETIFLMAKPEYSFLSSSQAREVAHYGGDLSKFVPKVVEAKLIDKYFNK